MVVYDIKEAMEVESNPAVAAREPAVATIHPTFANPSAEVALVSIEGTIFQIYALTLRETSGFFRDTLSLPQPAIEPSSSASVITLQLSEKSDTIEELLRVITAKEFPELDTWASLESFTAAAEKYDMPGPLSLARRLIMAPPFISDPIRVYAVACHHGWTKQASLAATATLSVDIANPSLTSSFAGIGWKELLKLFQLRQVRQERMCAFLNDNARFLPDISHCSSCHRPRDSKSWQLLKARIMTGMTKDASGEAITTGAFLEWPEARAVKDARCLCGLAYYEFSLTCSTILLGISQLPQTIQEVGINFI